MTKEKLQQNSPAHILIEFPFKWVLYDNDGKPKLNGHNLQKNLIKITGKSEQDILNKLGKLLKKYQSFVDKEK